MRFDIYIENYIKNRTDIFAVYRTDQTSAAILKSRKTQTIIP